MITKAWKLFHLRKDGTLGSLFINRRAVIQPGVWIKAENYPTEGYKLRPGWHSTKKPIAPHLSEKNRVWRKVLLKDVEIIKRPKAQGDIWFISGWIKVEK